MNKNQKRINLHPSVWGNQAWRYIHSVALGYPFKPTNKDKKLYKNFFLSLGKTLPCEKCTKNFSKHIKKINIDKYLGNPDDLFSWTVLLRNEVKKTIDSKNKVFLNPEIIKKEIMNLNIINIKNKNTNNNNKKTKLKTDDYKFIMNTINMFSYI